MLFETQITIRLDEGDEYDLRIQAKREQWLRIADLIRGRMDKL